MKLRRILSGVLAATVAISSVAMSAFTSFAADTDNVELKFKQGNCTSDGGKMKYAVDGSWAPQKVMEADSLAYLKGGNAAIKTITGTVTVTGTVAEPFNMYVCYADGSGNAYWGEGDSANKKTTEESPLISEPGTYEVTLTLDEVTSPTAVNYIGFDGSRNSFKNNPDAVVHADSLVINKTASSDEPVLGENDELVLTKYTDLDDGTISLEYAASESDSNCSVIIRDGVLTFPETIDGKTVTAVGDWFNEEPVKPVTKVIFPDTVTTITNNFGLFTEDVKEVVLPANLTSLGNRTFQKATGLLTTTIPSSVTSIGSQLFYNAGNADTNIYFDAAITEAPPFWAFYNTQGTIHVRSDKTTYDLIKAAANKATVVFEGEEDSNTLTITDFPGVFGDAEVVTNNWDGHSRLAYTINIDMDEYDNHTTNLTDEQKAKIQAMGDNIKKITYEVEVTGTIDSSFKLFPAVNGSELNIRADSNRGGSFVNVKGCTLTSADVTSAGTYTIVMEINDGVATSEILNAWYLLTLENNTYTNNPNATLKLKKMTVEAAEAPSIDYTALDTAIADGEAIDSSKYTVDSYAVLTTALGTAKAVKENTSATQDDVDAAAQAITDAIAALEEAPVEPVEIKWTGSFDRSSGLTTTDITGMTVTKGSGYMTFSGVDLSGMADPYVEVAFDANGSNDTLYVATSAWATVIGSSTDALAKASLADVKSTTSFIVTTNNKSGSYGKITSVRFYDAATEPQKTVVATYEIGANKVSDVIATVYDDGSMVISGTGATKDFFSAETITWASYLPEITSVTVEEGVTRLGQCLFTGMTNLKSVSLPDSLTEIWKYCFENCSSLTEVVIPKNVVQMTGNTFQGCTSLKKVTVLGSLNYLGSFTFDGCTALEEVSFASGLKEIPNYTFQGCSNLKSVIIPDTVTSIGKYAFSKCSSLKSITLPNGLESIGVCAFDRSGLTSVTIPENVTTLGNDAFCTCKDLASVTISSKKLTEIPYLCFGDCPLLKEVSFPDSVTGMAIGNGAFYHCAALESAALPSGVTSIGDTAFSGCTSLKSVTIPDSVTSIGASAFLNDAALATCEISSSSKLTSIGEHAFGATGIKSIKIPAEVTSIGRYAFVQCPALESVTFEGNKLKTIEEYVFRECKALKSIEIPEGVTTIKTQAFNYCENMTSVKLPSTLKTIGNYAFLNGLRLSTIEIPESVTTLGEGAFDCCGLQGDITIPASITKIPNYAFKYCAFPSLNIHVAGAITEVGSSAFAECTGKIYVNDKNTYDLINATDHGTAKILYEGAPDTTALEAAMDEAEKVDTTKYTAASVKTLTDAVAAANDVLANINATQDDVDAAAQAITDAISGLKDKPVVDFTELDNEIAITEDIINNHSEEYTPESIDDLKNALETAKHYRDPDITQPNIDWAANMLRLRRGYLVKLDIPTMLAELQAAIDEAKAVNPKNYTEDSYKALTDAITAAEAMNESSDYKEIQAAKNAITTAMNGLKEKPLEPFAYIYKKGATTTIINGAADNSMAGATSIKVTFDCADDVSFNQYASIEVKAVVAGTENYQKFVGNSWTTGATCDVTLPLASAINEGDQIDLSGFTYSWDNASDYVFAVTKVEFLDADGNVLKTVKAPEEISLDELNKAIEDAEAIDTTKYTDETVKALTDAIAAAKKVTTTSTEEEAQAAIDAINAAIEALELKPVVKTGTVSGKIVVSDGNAETEMTVTATAADGTETSVTATSMGTYTIENLALGEYTLTISGGKYVERTYEITVTEGSIDKEVNLNPLGDINGDGKVTTADVGMANSHAKGVKILEGYAFDCANVKNTDAEVTTADVGMINSHAKGVKTLW